MIPITALYDESGSEQDVPLMVFNLGGLGKTEA